MTQGNTGGDSTIRVALGSLSAGGQATISYLVLIADDLPDDLVVIENQGTVLSKESPAVRTDNPETREVGDPTRISVALRPLLVGEKEDSLWQDNDGSGNVSAGDVLLYQVTLEQPGRGDRGRRRLRGHAGREHNVADRHGAEQPGQRGRGQQRRLKTIRVAVGDVPAGEVVQISYAVRINDNLAPGLARISNQATFRGDNFGQGQTNDPDTPVFEDVTGTQLGVSTVLEAYKSDSIYGDLLDDGDIDPGDVVLYQIELLNMGSEPSTGVIFRDVLDLSTKLVVGSVRTSLGTVTGATASATRWWWSTSARSPATARCRSRSWRRCPRAWRQRCRRSPTRAWSAPTAKSTFPPTTPRRRCWTIPRSRRWSSTPTTTRRRSSYRSRCLRRRRRQPPHRR
ncbi:MAG: hypothetical protein R2856_12395 [Caldilineaceae bacterium]